MKRNMKHNSTLATVLSIILTLSSVGTVYAGTPGKIEPVPSDALQVNRRITQTSFLHITYTYPFDIGKSTVAVNMAYAFTFDASLKNIVNTTNISLLEDATGKAYDIEATVNPGEEGSGDFIVIRPKSDLLFTTGYTLTIGKDAVESTSGAKLENDYVIHLKTDPEFKRLSGVDRYATSIEISKEGWANAENVILATGKDFPDALSAAPMSSKFSAPILLTDPSVLRAETLAEIQRLGAKNVYIIGGFNAVSQEIENLLNSNLAAKGGKCIRIKGTDRYETSVAIAKQLDPSDTIVVATGKSFPDAMSIAPFAAYNNTPILLTDGKTLTASVKGYINAYKIIHSNVIGGTTAVSEQIKNSLPDATRIAGNNRYQTNFQIVSTMEANGMYAYLATGKKFPDALAGSALAWTFNSPILLIDKDMDPNVLETWASNKELMKTKYILGGTQVVPESLVQQIFK